MKSTVMDTTDNGSMRVYCDAKQGGRIYMEDVICVQSFSSDKHDAGGRTRNNRECLFFAVFDGHGGPEAALFAEKNLKDEIARQPTFWSDNDEDVIQAIKDGFVSTHNLMENAIDSWPQTLGGLPSTAGTTASVVIVRDGKIYVAHVGDSSVVFGENEQSSHSSGSDQPMAKCVTVEHKPDCAEERARIEQFGGEVISKAGVSRVVWKRPRIMLVRGLLRRHSTGFDSIPFLAVSRSLGDLWSYNCDHERYVVSPVPDVSVYKLDRNQQRFLIIASDGIWNMMSAEEAVNCVWSSVNSQNIDLDDSGNSCKDNPAAALVQNALDRWRARCMRADNTSAIIVLLQPPETIAESLPVRVKTKNLLTVKMPFNRRAAVIRKSVFLSRPSVAIRRTHWCRALPVSVMGKVRRRIRRMPVVSSRVAASAKKLVGSVLLHDGAQLCASERRHCGVLIEPKWSSMASLSEQSSSCVLDVKHLMQKTSNQNTCLTMKSVVNSKHTTKLRRKLDAKCRASNTDLDFKVNLDNILESGRILLTDESKIDSVCLHSASIGSAAKQHYSIERKGCH